MIVVSPHLVLMKGQVASYSAKKFSVGSVTHKITVTERCRVREGNYQLVYFSPESLRSLKYLWFNQLQLEPYYSNVV